MASRARVEVGRGGAAYSIPSIDYYHSSKTGSRVPTYLQISPFQSSDRWPGTLRPYLGGGN